MSRPSPSVEDQAHIWFATIQDKGSKRKIKVRSKSQFYALRMAKTFCVSGEKVIELFNCKGEKVFPSV